MISTEINKQDIIIAWVVALLIHVLVFSFTAKMFISPPKFAIAPSRTIDISLIDTPKEVVQVQQQPKPVIKQVEKTILKKVKPVVKPIEKSKQVMVPKHLVNHQKIAASSSAPRKDTNRVPNEAIGPLAKPDYIQNPPPPYPALAKQMHQEGLVLLSVDVDKKGDPVSVDIVQSSGFVMLDRAAIKAVRHWKFQPGRIGGIAIESQVRVPIRFCLQE